LKFISGTEGMTTGPCSDRALTAFLNALEVPIEQMKKPAQAPTELRPAFDPGAPSAAASQEQADYTQKLLREAERARADFFWSKVKPTQRKIGRLPAPLSSKSFGKEVIGRLPSPACPSTRAHAASNCQSPPGFQTHLRHAGRRHHCRKRLHRYEVCWTFILTCLPGAFCSCLKTSNQATAARGRLPARPRRRCPWTLSPRTRRPQAFGYYKGFAARLAERGFVVLAPHNPYRARTPSASCSARPTRSSNLFSPSLRPAQPLAGLAGRASLCGCQAHRLLRFSYGGRTAMRVPALLDRYCLSICSGCFNQWTRKIASVDFDVASCSSASMKCRSSASASGSTTPSWPP